MNAQELTNCPGTLAKGFNTYSRTCLKRMFQGKAVSHVLAYDSPLGNSTSDQQFEESRKRISISGVQEKFSMLLDRNKLRLTNEGEHGTYIIKTIPSFGKKPDQMPANEHVTMQIARQVFGIETAENALIFFRNGTPAYITKRFDVQQDGSKLAQEDFASLAGRTPQTHGEHFKYAGNYLELFELMKKHLATYKIEATKLMRILIFNYLFSNGDAHFKNFSILETPMGDFRLSPAYDLLNSRIHMDDNDFALEDGLLPRNLSTGNIRSQFSILAQHAEINEKLFDNILIPMVSKSDKVEVLLNASFLNEPSKRNYWQAYNTRLKRLLKE
jgi:serine/threonine-protein kinase HipA